MNMFLIDQIVSPVEKQLRTTSAVAYYLLKHNSYKLTNILNFVDLSNTFISIKVFIELKHGATKCGEYKKLLESTGYYTAEEW